MVHVNDERRRFIARLLSPTAVEDALTAYYALYHKRTQLFTHGQEAVDGFLAICQTGHDLFTPLVVMRADSDDMLSALLSDHLDESWEYFFAAKEQRASVLKRCLVTWDEHYDLIYTVDEVSFRPDSRHLVEKVVKEDRVSRFEIRDGESVIAAAGTNWRSPYFAEVGVAPRRFAGERAWPKQSSLPALLNCWKGGSSPSTSWPRATPPRFGSAKLLAIAFLVTGSSLAWAGCGRNGDRRPEPRPMIEAEPLGVEGNIRVSKIYSISTPGL